MTNSTENKGGCLCGSIEVLVRNITYEVGVCHCGMCRKWGGGPYMEVHCGRDVSFSNEEFITVFSSSAWAERGFCSICGTHLFYRLKESGDHMLPVGIFPDDGRLTLNKQVFIDEKPSFYSYANETEEMTGAEVFEKFG